MTAGQHLCARRWIQASIRCPQVISYLQNVVHSLEQLPLFVNEIELEVAAFSSQLGYLLTAVRSSGEWVDRLMEETRKFVHTSPSVQVPHASRLRNARLSKSAIDPRPPSRANSFDHLERLETELPADLDEVRLRLR